MCCKGQLQCFRLNMRWNRNRRVTTKRVAFPTEWFGVTLPLSEQRQSIDWRGLRFASPATHGSW